MEDVNSFKSCVSGKSRHAIYFLRRRVNFFVICDTLVPRFDSENLLKYFWGVMFCNRLIYQSVDICPSRGVVFRGLDTLISSKPNDIGLR